MEEFAFLVHPMSVEDVAKKYKIASKVSPKMVATVLKRRRPFPLAEINGLRSKNGTEAHGWFVAVPLLPGQFRDLDEDYVVKKIAKACKVAEKKGAKIVGLGAFTATVGDGGRKIAELVDVPITTGNTYTVAIAIEGTIQAAEAMGIEPSQASLAVLGATGSIGRTCALALAPRFARTTLVGRDLRRLQKVVDEVSALAPGKTKSSSDIESSIRQADVIVSVTGAANAVIEPEHIKPGAVVCDVARPRDVAEAVAKLRDDVLVIDGGVVKVPSSVDLHSILNLPKGLALACVAETMILALEKRYECYTLGKDISLEKVEEISELAEKHGFGLAGLRSFDRLLSREELASVKAKARATQSA